MLQDIWPNKVKIEVLGVTGEYSSGKTLFILTIDPANTLYYDLEKSGGTYAEALGVDRIDIPDQLNAVNPSGYTPREVFEFWLKHVRSVPTGKYSVIAVDPLEDLEGGLVDHVKSRHKEWGYKSEEGFYSTGGIFWARVRSEWKRILADIAARCQTFAFSTHLRAVWKHGRPTAERESKGKSTLRELASLFLFLERETTKDGATPTAPSAITTPPKGKSRLAATFVKDGVVKIGPMLPPRIPVATPERIREYIINPPDYGKLALEEQEHEKELTEADRLRLEAQIASEKRAASEANLEAVERRKELLQASEQALAKVHSPPPSVVKDESSAKDGQNGASKNQKAVDMLRSVKGDPDKTKGLSRYVWQTLKGRGVDVSTFKSPADVNRFITLLSDKELAGFVG